MELFHRVIVALAGEESDTGLLRYCRVLAEIVPTAVFEFVHVREPEAPADYDIEKSVGQQFGNAGRANCRVVSGYREDQILREAASLAADVILVGHRKKVSGRRALARRLAMKAPCSVWLVPEGSEARISGILVAVDFSHHSEHAVSIATAIAQRRGLGSCRALHVYFNPSIAGIEEYQSHVRGREQQAFDEFIGDLDLHGVTVDPVFEESPSVAHAIQRAVDQGGVDLVVMGTRGLSRSASILLGSQSEETIMETRVPVLVVKRRGERMGLLDVLLEHQHESADSLKFG